MLTSQQILEKCKTDSLSNVNNINLWGNELKDISILKDVPNVEVVSLSVNNINTLKYFSYCKNLRELYLRKNQISNLEEINYLKNNSKLKILWLGENPICALTNYRNFVIYNMPQLSKLDNVTITQIEREESAAIYSSPSKNSYKAKGLDENRMDIRESSNINYKDMAMQNIINESMNNMNKSGTVLGYSHGSKTNLSSNIINPSITNVNNNMNPTPISSRAKSSNKAPTKQGKQNNSNVNLPKVEENLRESVDPTNTLGSQSNAFNEYTYKQNKILHPNPSQNINILKEHNIPTILINTIMRRLSGIIIIKGM